MELRVIDFDILTRNFQPYVDGYLTIESSKRKMLDSIQPQKKEIESIISRSSSGLITDTQDRDMARFKELQDSLMKSDVEFKRTLKTMQEELNTSVYDQLSEIVSVWAKENSIDLVMGKMEVIFNNKSVDATDQILEAVKDRGLYFNKEKEILQS